MTRLRELGAIRRAPRPAWFVLVAAVSLALALISFQDLRAEDSSRHGPAITILAYHRFGPVVADGMTVTTPVFEWQLRYLREHGYAIVRLDDVVEFVKGRKTLPARAVAITADDGHRSIFTVMKPLVERQRIPVTLFIYPSAISNATYAMTWEQLQALKATGLFSIQSHAYWHPNFHIEKKRLSADEYRKLVEKQLITSRQILQRRAAVRADMLAWPFGIYDDELMMAASKAGYIAAFTIDRHNVSAADNLMALPRYLVTDRDRGNAFAAMLSGPDTHAAEDRTQQRERKP